MGCITGKGNIKESVQSPKSKKTSEPAIDKKNLIQQQKTLFSSNYTFGKLLGKGSFASVFVVNHKITKKLYATKVIQKDSMTESEHTTLLQEMHILSTLDHPHIMNIIEYFDEEEFFYIVMDFYEGRQFFDKISDDEQTEETIKQYFKQILLALNYALENKIMHCDLKPDNIIFDLKSEPCCLKILDWGLAQYYEKKIIQKAIGTPLYMAPEVTKKQLTKTSDMWSVGIMLYECFYGQHPFMDHVRTMDDLFFNVANNEPQFNNDEVDISQECINVIKGLLTKNPDKRPSASQILNYPWFANTSTKNDNIINKKSMDNLKNFCKASQMQKAISLYLANFFLNIENKNKLALEFEKLDKNKDGTLSKQEFIQFKDQLQMTNKQIEELFDQIDMNQNDKVDFNEFLLAASEKQNLINKENIKKAFDMLDADKNKVLTSNELTLIFGSKNMENDAWMKLIKSADKNQDGQLSLEEFQEILFEMTKDQVQ